MDIRLLFSLETECLSFASSKLLSAFPPNRLNSKITDFLMFVSELEFTVFICCVNSIQITENPLM